MNVRHFAAASLVVVLAVLGVGATGASGGQAADTLTVWLQVDAQTGWPEVVAAANAQFEAANPGWNVDVQYQTWGTHLQSSTPRSPATPRRTSSRWGTPR